MVVRVRLFAALREAAGTAEEQLEAGLLPELLAQLCSRHGEVFASRLAISTVLLDGSATAQDTAVEVADGSELALLPPVSGGT